MSGGGEERRRKSEQVAFMTLGLIADDLRNSHKNAFRQQRKINKKRAIPAFIVLEAAGCKSSMLVSPLHLLVVVLF